MKYQFRDDPPYPQSFGVERWWSTEPDSDGIVEVPEDHDKYEAIVERCDSLDRLERVNEYKEPETIDEPDRDPLSGYTEEQIVTAEYRELQQIAGEYDDIKGNASEGEIEEALIYKLREENE